MRWRVNHQGGNRHEAIGEEMIERGRREGGRERLRGEEGRSEEEEVGEEPRREREITG